MGLPGGFGASVQMRVCEWVVLVPVSCWAVASLCSISHLSALWAVAQKPSGDDVDVKGGTHALIQRERDKSVVGGEGRAGSIPPAVVIWQLDVIHSFTGTQTCRQTKIEHLEVLMLQCFQE